MTSSARTVFYFGIYLFGVGITLLLSPNFMLRLFELPETSEVWVRVVGMLVGYLGFYYVQAGRMEMEGFIRLSVFTRSTAIIFFAGFVWFGFAEPPFILFGALDFLGALWTWWALRLEGRISS
ncbi:MAG: hypothetical protein IPM98_10460 [Lewinellaceae bacterium]|nr:hypothetical protein [Lewinellaceae bacterium]